MDGGGGDPPSRGAPPSAPPSAPPAATSTESTHRIAWRTDHRDGGRVSATPSTDGAPDRRLEAGPCPAVEESGGILGRCASRAARGEARLASESVHGGLVRRVAVVMALFLGCVAVASPRRHSSVSLRRGRRHRRGDAVALPWCRRRVAMATPPHYFYVWIIFREITVRFQIERPVRLVLSCPVPSGPGLSCPVLVWPVLSCSGGSLVRSCSALSVLVLRW